MSHVDPYQLDPNQIETPPTSLWGMLRNCGPGLILSASIVGSGELIATTALGAKTGFTALWVILVSCGVKVALQLEMGRHTIQSGVPCLQALNALGGPRIGRTHWTIWCWFLLQPIKMLQMGGIVGGVGQLIHMAFPAIDIGLACWGSALFVAALVAFEGYRFIERTCLALLSAFTLVTLWSLVALQWTPYAISWSDVAEGLTFRFPPGALLFIVGTFGLTGVGGDEIMHYSYWLIEKGYAAKTGAYRPGDAAWVARARGWSRVMYFDALSSMVVYTVVTAAFYLLGAAVLANRSEVPSGHAMVATLANMYTETLGPQARWVFLAGATAVLFSTLFSALAAWSRVFTDAFGIFGWLDFRDLRARRLSVASVSWGFPLLWSAIYLYYREPTNMVMIGGVGTALILLIMAIAIWQFRFRCSLPELAPGAFYDAALWLSLVVIGLLALTGISKLFFPSGSP